jgi:ElaB/YqjD/DUF883 family membrane-anchored ribosome-binding protein
MSDATSRDETSPPEPTEAEQLREEIAETREDLGDTVEALAAKADVKAQAQAKVEETKAQAQQKVEETKAQAQQKVEETSEQVKENPVPVAALAGGVAAGILLLVLLKRKRG